MLIDAFVRERSGGAISFDRDGALALAGNVDDGVLSALLGDAYFALRPPKTTGRERFGAQFLSANACRARRAHAWKTAQQRLPH